MDSSPSTSQIGGQIRLVARQRVATGAPARVHKTPAPSKGMSMSGKPVHDESNLPRLEHTE
jgi:hypothetical protein